MNRLETIKRAIIGVTSGLKNLLYKDYLNRLSPKSVTYTLLPSGFAATSTIASGGYGNYISTIILDNPTWGNTYTVTCNVGLSHSNMNSLMRVGYFRSDTSTWQNFKEQALTSGNGKYSIMVTLPVTPPDNFVSDISQWSGGVRLFFNVQRTSLGGEYATLTVTDIVVNEVK